MTSEVADAAVDLLLDKAAGDRVSLFFFGGEPLLEQKLMQRATERAQAAEELEVEVGVTTNGVLLAGQALEQCRAAEMRIALSADGDAGPAERVSAGGVDSTAQLQERLPDILSLEPDCPITARMTVTPANVSHLADNVQALARAGLRRIVFLPAYELDWTDEAVALWAREHRRIGTWLRGMTGAGQRPPSLPGWQGIEARLAGGKPRRACGAGTRAAAVSTEGEIYPCYRFVFAEDAADYRLGDVSTGLSNDRALALMQSLQPQHLKPEEGDCASCPSRDGCTFFCPALGHLMLRDPLGVPAAVCGLMRAQVEAIRPTAAVRRPRGAGPVPRGAWVTAAAFTGAMVALGAASCSSDVTTSDDDDDTQGGLCPVQIDGGQGGAGGEPVGGLCPVEIDAGIGGAGGEGGLCPIEFDAGSGGAGGAGGGTGTGGQGLAGIC